MQRAKLQIPRRGPALALLALASLATSSLLVIAQYDSAGGGHPQYGGGSGEHGGHYDDYAMEERPKVNLGIRLRIPAFKFELPRFSLPKITVSAKIRQPDRPRVIQLPEINLDTSSKIEPPNKMGGGGGGSYSGSPSQYHPSPSYGGSSYGGGSHPSYGGGEEKSSMFTFSTSEEAHPQGYGARSNGNYGGGSQYKTTNKYQSPAKQVHYKQQQQQNHYQRPMQYQQQQQYHTNAYSSTNESPTYSVYNRAPGGDEQASYQYQVESGAARSPVDAGLEVLPRSRLLL